MTRYAPSSERSDKVARDALITGIVIVAEAVLDATRHSASNEHVRRRFEAHNDAAVLREPPKEGTKRHLLAKDQIQRDQIPPSILALRCGRTAKNPTERDIFVHSS
ncbi:MAG TPA: hypothetical protein VMU99_06200 [Acidimicrobiales bacterium]|nr:hypothetical protein [Acidimicrobiales bacterium]